MKIKIASGGMQIVQPVLAVLTPEMGLGRAHKEKESE
jgi:hypothetical protein